MRMPVLVLQAFAVQRGAPGGRAEQEAARALVGGGPGKVADALQAEHRVEDVERHRDLVRMAVRRRRRDPGANRARLVDALLEDLALLVLAVVHHLVLVHRLVLLALRREDAELAEHAFHAEGARLVRNDRHDALAQFLVAHQRGEDPHERHGGRDLAALARALEHLLERRERRHRRRRRRLAPALREIAAQRLAMRLQVLHLRRIGRRNVERQLVELVVRDRDVEAVAHLADRRDIDFLQLVGRVLRLALLAHAESLDGLGEDHGGLALVLHRRRVRGVDLVRVVAAAVQAPDVLVAHARDHLQDLRVLAEEMLAHESAVVGLEVLVLAVDGFLHDAQQHARPCRARAAGPSTSPRSA